MKELISIIIPIYNTEKYLRETIDSVICQTLSFAEHIRLILLDDASTDGSFAICEQYQKQYPKQIVVKHMTQTRVFLHFAMKAYGLPERWVMNLLPF